MKILAIDTSSKNAAVAILPATLLVNGICKIENLPNLHKKPSRTIILIPMLKPQKLEPSIQITSLECLNWLDLPTKKHLIML